MISDVESINWEFGDSLILDFSNFHVKTVENFESWNMIPKVVQFFHPRPFGIFIGCWSKLFGSVLCFVKRANILHSSLSLWVHRSWILKIFQAWWLQSSQLVVLQGSILNIDVWELMYFSILLFPRSFSPSLA